jgi:peroxiredoxin
MFKHIILRRNQMLRKLIIILLSSLFLTTACNQKNQTIKEGIWRGVLNLQNQELPFIFEIVNSGEGDFQAVIINGEERLNAGSIIIKNDSIFIPMHVFDSHIAAKFEGNNLKGVWQKNYVEDYEIDFTAEFGLNERFPSAGMNSNSSIDGKFDITFTTQEGKQTPAIGLFSSKSGKLLGTFMTATGDYRYLEGTIQSSKILLSTFDGEHAYLFTAEIEGDQIINGEFWSGKTGYRKWVGSKNNMATLPDPNSLTYLKDGYDKIEFSFPGIDGQIVSPENKKYQNKVLILQIFGTWCPNCMDETKFLAEWYRKNIERGVEIIGLSYEKKDDLEYAKSRILKIKERFNVEYDFAFAGLSDNNKAAETLPMLNHVMSFPTTIFIDKQGRVRKIHTGFNGPGTGKYYAEFIIEFNDFLNILLNEE